MSVMGADRFGAVMLASALATAVGMRKTGLGRLAWAGG